MMTNTTGTQLIRNNIRNNKIIIVSIEAPPHHNQQRDTFAVCLAALKHDLAVQDAETKKDI